MAAMKKSEKRRGPGRPPVNPPGMDHRNQIRSYFDDREAWDAAALADGRKFSDWARRTLNEKCGRTGANRGTP